MASTQYTAIGNYTAEWASLYDISFPPEIRQQWYQRYGKGFKILDFLRMFGRTQTTANRLFYHYEDAAEQRVITLADNGTGHGIDTGGAGVTRSIMLAAGDFDTNNNGPLRENFTVLVPKLYQHASVAKDRWYVVTTVGAGVGVAITYTITPLDDDARIGTNVPVGTELIIGPSHYAPGTGQPDGMTTGTYRRTHRTNIVKETVGFEGGQIAQRSYRDTIPFADGSGNPRLFDMGTIETEFRLDDQIDSSLFIGEENDNTAVLVQTSQAGGTPVRGGTKGIWNWQTELAQSLSYIDDFDMEYFDQVKPLLQSQGVIDTSVLFCYGSNLGLKVENGVLEALKEWSGGSDLLSEGNKMFGVNFKTVQKNSVNFICKELASFANPNKLGNASYQFKDAGMMIPIGMATVSKQDGSKVTVPNISICFYNHNGEDRTRIVGTVAGLNGMGYQIVDQYDRTNVFMLSEFATFVANCNQQIQITKA